MAVKFEADDGVAVITIDRPGARNAIDRATAVALEESVQRLNSDRALRAGVLTGTVQ